MAGYGAKTPILCDSPSEIVNLIRVLVWWHEMLFEWRSSRAMLKSNLISIENISRLGHRIFKPRAPVSCTVTAARSLILRRTCKSGYYPNNGTQR